MTALPTRRLPGIEAVAREVLGFDVWEGRKRNGGPLAMAWMMLVDEASDDPAYTRAVPLSLPAGRLVAETWWDRTTHQPLPERDALHAACLYLGDLLRLCSALGVEVPAGTVPRLEPLSRTWLLRSGDDSWWFALDDGETLRDMRRTTVVPGLRMDADPRAALDAILAAVVPHADR